MARSAPQVSFSVTSIDFGTIDVGASSAFSRYDIFLHGNSTIYTEALNMSISFKGSTQGSEAKDESWVIASTASERTPITSLSGGSKECSAGSVVAGRTRGGISVPAGAKVSVPAAAATAGRVAFYLHHRYQYTG
uniref:Uncharacterized protein n=1 Tax=viral metagenome TaxID=1070528 RepID=A0A6M3MF02_9ZZZZ